jgi:hypothetical protein
MCAEHLGESQILIAGSSNAIACSFAHKAVYCHDKNHGVDVSPPDAP